MKFFGIIDAPKILFSLLGLTLFIAPPAFSLEAASIIENNRCGSCHKMSGPPAQTIEEVLQKKGPDLFYAGSKFKKEWLLKYLQQPVTIRPAGVVYVRNVKTVDGQDITQNQPGCQSRLSIEQATAVANHLMALKDPRVKAGTFHKQSYIKFMLEIKIFSQLACNGCHTFPNKGGGKSGSTFVGVGNRLNPDWMVSFIKNPQAHSPWIWMPKYELNDNVVQQIVSYLSSIK